MCSLNVAFRLGAVRNDEQGTMKDNMRKIYELLSKPAPLAGWIADEAMPERFLAQGTVLDDGATIENLQCAVRIFSDLIVEREFGEHHTAHLISTFEVAGGVIVEVTPGEPTGDGRSYYLSRRCPSPFVCPKKPDSFDYVAESI
jgi:hypothetical protein